MGLILQKRTLVLGLGKSGQSVIRHLSRQGVPLSAADTRNNPPGLDRIVQQFPGLSLHLGPLEQALLCAVERIVLSPGISYYHPALQAAIRAGVEVVSDVELFAREVSAPVVAITGSNGKSTVTTLVAEMAAAAGMAVRAGGNLGTPALDLLQPPAVDLYVIELSSFQLESIKSLAPAAAVVLNVSADHLDRYQDLSHYAAVKGRIYQHAECLIYAADDPLVVGLMEQFGNPSADRYPYYQTLSTGGKPGYGVGDELNGGGGISRAGEPWMAIESIRMVGHHNRMNAVAALTLGAAVGLPESSMVETLQRFSGLPHRTEWVAELQGVGWVNDSKGTNVGATEAALAGLSSPAVAEKIVWIAGGQGKGADFSPLRSLVAERVRAVVLMGEDATTIAAALGSVVPLHYAKDMMEAVRIAHAIARPGDTVLLSPACASFDQYSGFEARGLAFVTALERLKGEER
ncbi:MAG: UDP-N-acetylmuramoyl-L-alanine--D-glutamate ligase [Gammaproteobacteria bacterium]|jgi:UDP-N-acetylmuramoylalanine--D-glutamate ligase|nr:UDP-N-acetylmuramoyl-L-alanine--D-glutamate ligase [Gammaproteobacteria bacterium]MBT7307171.1 UDP-N-acetylmuramoyl-L-alanine--D-glutamate ligase [Gammaproteobacteria bacterium]